MAIVGLKGLHYALITEEGKAATTYGEVKELGPAIALGLTPAVNSENLRADDSILFTETAKGATAVTLNTAYLDESVEADILGKTLDEHGGILDSAEDNAPYIAIGGKAKSARGGYEFFWIYRVKLTPGEESKNTSEETPAYQTPSLEGESLPRLNDGAERYKLWDGNETITDPTIFDEWFNEVIDPDWTAVV